MNTSYLLLSLLAISALMLYMNRIIESNLLSKEDLLEVICYTEWKTAARIREDAEIYFDKELTDKCTQEFLRELLWGHQIDIHVPDPGSGLLPSYRRKSLGSPRPCDVIPVGIPSTQPA